MVSDYGLLVNEFMHKHEASPRYEFISRYLWCPGCKDTPIATRIENGFVQIQLTKRTPEETRFVEIKRHDGKLICPICETELSGDERP
jgi:hypothetical protein